MDMPWITDVATTIASGTTAYLVTFSPVYILMGGLLLGFIIMGALIAMITGRRSDYFDENDDDDRV